MSASIKNIYNGLNDCKSIKGVLPLLETLPMSLMHIKMLSDKEVRSLILAANRIMPDIRIINDDFRINKLFNLPSVAIKQEYI